MQQIQKVVDKYFPQHDVNLCGFVPVKSIPVFLNSVFHDLGYNTITVDEQQAHQIFEIMDSNDDKVVTREEITKGLLRILNTHGNLDKPQPTLSNMSVASGPRQNQIEQLQLNYLFQKYDKNQSGFLDTNQIVDFINEYMKIIGKTHVFNSKQDQVLISWLDKDHDKKISKQEIWKMYTNHLIGYS